MGNSKRGQVWQSRSIQNQSGQVLLQSLVVVLVVSVLGGVAITMFRNEQKRIQDQGKSGTRNALAVVLNNYISSPSILKRSLFNQACLAEKLETNAPLLYKTNPSCKITAGSSPSSGTFYPVALYSPVPGSTERLTGPPGSPVMYSVNGERCTSPSELCPFEVTTEVEWGVDYPEHGLTKPAVRVRYFVRNQSNGALNGQRVATYTFQGMATTSLDKINGRGVVDADPDKTYTQCRQADQSGVDLSRKDQVEVGVEFVSGGGAPGQNEKAQCLPAESSRLCPPDMWQVGINANGDPVCAGKKEQCPDGQIHMGFTTDGAGQPIPRCVLADCRNVGMSGRFGFMRPSINDDLNVSVGCLTLSPTPPIAVGNPSPCAGKIITGVTSSGELRCD